jgi:hypothetical protein
MIFNITKLSYDKTLIGNRKNIGQGPSASLYHLNQAMDKPAAARVRSCRQADDAAEILRDLGYYIMWTI